MHPRIFYADMLLFVSFLFIVVPLTITFSTLSRAFRTVANAVSSGYVSICFLMILLSCGIIVASFAFLQLFSVYYVLSNCWEVWASWKLLLKSNFFNEGLQITSLGKSLIQPTYSDWLEKRSFVQVYPLRHWPNQFEQSATWLGF